MVPNKISPNLKIVSQLKNKNSDDTLVEGTLVCCNSNEFEVQVVGKIKCNVFSKMYVVSENKQTVIKTRCKKCGKVISVFNSNCDGYEQSNKSECECALTNSIKCKKCKHNDFSVYVKYEYPDIKELNDLKISEPDNAFTWIWITLECNKCGAKYRNFVDLETS